MVRHPLLSRDRRRNIACVPQWADGLRRPTRGIRTHSVCWRHPIVWQRFQKTRLLTLDFVLGKFVRKSNLKGIWATHNFTQIIITYSDETLRKDTKNYRKFLNEKLWKDTKSYCKLYTLSKNNEHSLTLTKTFVFISKRFVTKSDQKLTKHYHLFRKVT